MTGFILLQAYINHRHQMQFLWFFVFVFVFGFSFLFAQSVFRRASSGLEQSHMRILLTLAMPTFMLRQLYTRMQFAQKEVLSGMWVVK